MTKKLQFGVFHPGTQHSWQTTRALQHSGALKWYATSIFYQPDRWPYSAAKIMPGRARALLEKEFSRFHHPDIDLSLVHTQGMHEWIERLFARAKWRRASAWINLIGNRKFGHDVGHLIRKTNPNVVWGYDSSAKEGFETAKQLGITNILDVTIGDPRIYNEIMKGVHQEYAEFFLAKAFLIDQKRIDRLDEEYDLADIILAGSEFCKNTILDKRARPDLEKKVRVLHYCYDDVFFSPTSRPRLPASRNQPVKFLFLGQAGPRKGIHLLLNAISRIPESAASLTIVGDLQVPDETFARFSDRVQLIRTVPRSRVREFLLNADCLVFPSYFEGSALTLYEALASGTAIIQSKNAGTAADENTGIVLESLSAESVYTAMMKVIEDRQLLDHWAAGAPARAEQFSFSRYQSAVADLAANLAAPND
ncbi:glycosyltransferase family 4 protein [Bradyrhizobium sp. DASA03007]|uniref:glycosyltransferase family 4 protein n=1 Tax=unclassified Bradyrhizobium TaxID=2631580 RepID=UPI003F710D55